MITNLRCRILETGVSQYRIAGAAKIHPSVLSKYALGLVDIPPRHVVPLCEVLRCDPDDIEGWADG